MSLISKLSSELVVVHRVFTWLKELGIWGIWGGFKRSAKNELGFSPEERERAPWNILGQTSCFWYPIHGCTRTIQDYGCFWFRVSLCEDWRTQRYKSYNKDRGACFNFHSNKIRSCNRSKFPPRSKPSWLGVIFYWRWGRPCHTE